MRQVCPLIVPAVKQWARSAFTRGIPRPNLGGILGLALVV